jgi:hypothetical protein
MDLPSTFWDYMIRKWLNDAPVFPISQVFGFNAFTFQPAPTILTSEATTSMAYVDLATSGPTLTGLAAGQYAVFFGTQVDNGSGVTDTACVSVSINGSAASDLDSAVVTAISPSSATTMRLIFESFPTGGNTIKVQYRTVAGNQLAFQRRWLVAAKFANV